MKFGGVGDDLIQILNDARKFVKLNGDEFLVLRFSKCTDMQHVAEMYASTLGADMLSSNMHLNTALVSTLRGKVIVLIDSGEWGKVSAHFKAGHPGVMQVKARFNKTKARFKKATIDPPEYNSHFLGLQYFGKYSNTGDAKKNQKSQAKIMKAAGSSTAPELMGMVY
ncbi:MAG: hypothetical protein ACI87W_001590 [Halieaceae bacterium]|jgi:hypothetical protein